MCLYLSGAQCDFLLLALCLFKHGVQSCIIATHLIRNVKRLHLQLTRDCTQYSDCVTVRHSSVQNRGAFFAGDTCSQKLVSQP